MCIISKGTCRITRIKHIVKFKYSIRNVMFFLLSYSIKSSNIQINPDLAEIAKSTSNIRLSFFIFGLFFTVHLDKSNLKPLKDALLIRVWHYTFYLKFL